MDYKNKTEEKSILLLGDGGHCGSVLDSLVTTGDYQRIGIIEKEAGKSNNPLFIGIDSDLLTLFGQGWCEAFITVGSIGDTSVREKLYYQLKTIGFKIPVIIDPTAAVARDAIIKEGTYIGKRAVINSGCIIGTCAIINSGAIIEHGCIVDEFCHISSGAVLCGAVSVFKQTHVGAGSVVKQGMTIGKHSLIGIGSVITKDLPEYVVAYGNPCTVMSNYPEE